MSTGGWSQVGALRRSGALFGWATNEQGNRRHAFPDRCLFHGDPAYCHRSHYQRALCGNAYAATRPWSDNSALPSCVRCERLLEASA